AIESGQSQARIEELQSAEHIAGMVWSHIFAAIPANELLDATLVSEAVQSQYPGLITMYRPPVSIYDDPLLLIDLTKAVRTFFRAGTVSAGEHVFGTDKIIHFVNVGRIYHAKYEARLKRGLPEKEAIKSAIASTSRNFLLSESGVLGVFTTGILSNGDLAANYAGLMFYRNLTETVHIGPRTLPPMLERDGPLWRVQISPGSDVFVAFITPHWNEVLNPNKYVRYTSGRISTLVRERCPQVLDWYRDPRGQTRDRAQFETIERELATYYGDDYGHQSNITNPVTVADLCFPGSADKSVGMRDDRVPSAPSRDSAVTASARGPDTLGRTPLWWAAREGDVKKIRLLTEGSRTLDLADVDGETPLHAATRSGNTAAVHELASRGADLDRASVYGVTPLMLAAASGRTELAVALLEAGASPNARDLFGKTALHDAALHGNRLLTNRLLESGADPRIANDGGTTPLQLAGRRGHETIVTLLVAHGADATARNDASASARDEAQKQEHVSTVDRRLMDAHTTARDAHTTVGLRAPQQPGEPVVARSVDASRSPDRNP
ncbi:MAG TPA: ankyrin repeat domain-containing protein, partial [Burkholderiaceae bacterium]|nr:ankyrin repeat domain-containing protein [Burkholderiaceae bacterium]